MRAMQGSRFPWLQRFTRIFIRAGFQHFLTFDAKPRQYEDHIIRLAEDRSGGGRIVAVGCAALKTAQVHGNMCKVAYIFDLRLGTVCNLNNLPPVKIYQRTSMRWKILSSVGRVDEEYQGCGVGKALTQQIEDACEARGAKFLYLTVNADNVKAKSLYAKRGFVHASHRSPAMAFLAFPEQEEEDIEVQDLDKEAARAMTLRFYASADLSNKVQAPSQDLLLSNLGQLFDSPLYEAFFVLQGTFIARRGESLAGVRSSLTGFKIERLFLPISWWRSGACRFLGSAAGLVAVLRLVQALQIAGTSAAETHSTKDVLWLIGLIGLTSSSVYFVWKVWPVLSFLADKIISNNTKMRHRLFGPFGFGPKEDQEQLMRSVLKRVHNVARESGYAMSICNMDASHPLRPFFPSNKFSTTFMYKFLRCKQLAALERRCVPMKALGKGWGIALPCLRNTKHLSAPCKARSLKHAAASSPNKISELGRCQVDRK
ncbi:esyt3 [Symbiodinium natans]|uniref:Esyt3 protein n=1 Tax=Symbiodinium natans TaxID=878477 RepID=A0A812JHM9_9DINO|nr:esyt3 [Symbiodinium natans]